jgi:hypothetical protein
MRNKFLLNLIIIFSINASIFLEAKSQINNSIVAKVGNMIVSSIDVQNEIMTNLFLQKVEITQENVNNSKNNAIKNLINKSIKRGEVNKFKIKDYNKKDLTNYIEKTAKIFNTNSTGLKKIFQKNNLNYDAFVKNYETELLWNTLIFQIYNNQININIIDVENDITILSGKDKFQYNLSEIEITKTQYSKQKINEILEVVKNEGFEIAAKKFSTSPSAKKSGLIGWLSGSSLSNKFLEQIKNLDIKEVSKPIINENSVTLLKINAIKKEEKISDINTLRKKVIENKKREKLNLFSRSHFSNLENTISITFL